MGAARVAKSLPLKVAAVCYRRKGTTVEILLVNTNGGRSWRTRHDRAATLSSLHSVEVRLLAARWRAGICRKGVPDGDPSDAQAGRIESTPDLVQSRRSQAPSGERTRSKIFPRTRSSHRSRDG